MQYNEIRRALDHTLADEAGTIGESMPTKWVMLFESIDSEGRPSLHEVSSDELTSWDALGMLNAAIAKYRAIINDSFVEED